MHEEEARVEPRKKENTFWELVKFALLALLIVIPVRIFIAQPFIVSGSSMDPTFQNGEYLIVDQITYRFQDPERGDVVIFRFPQDRTKFFIKRIIGLPGDTLQIKGTRITIINDDFPEGFAILEPYIKHKGESFLEVELDADEFFVMGDNRAASSDSRVWGPLPERLVVGRAFLRLLPLAEASYMPGDYKL